MGVANPKFDLDLKRGQIGEEQLKELLEDTKIEVKRDFECGATGRVAVEVRYKGKPSGVMATESAWMAFILSGLYADEVVIMVKTSRLKSLLRQKERAFWHEMGGDDNQSELVMVPINQLLSLVGPESNQTLEQLLA